MPLIHRFYNLCCQPTLAHFFLLHMEPPPTEIYTLSLHDALPIFAYQQKESTARVASIMENTNLSKQQQVSIIDRSEERVSRNAETDLVCRLLLEKKKPRRRERGVDLAHDIALDLAQKLRTRNRRDDSE